MKMLFSCFFLGNKYALVSLEGERDIARVSPNRLFVRVINARSRGTRGRSGEFIYKNSTIPDRVIREIINRLLE